MITHAYIYMWSSLAAIFLSFCWYLWIFAVVFLSLNVNGIMSSTPLMNTIDTIVLLSPKWSCYNLWIEVLTCVLIIDLKFFFFFVNFDCFAFELHHVKRMSTTFVFYFDASPLWLDAAKWLYGWMISQLCQKHHLSYPLTIQMKSNS